MLLLLPKKIFPRKMRLLSKRPSLPFFYAFAEWKAAENWHTRFKRKEKAMRGPLNRCPNTHIHTQIHARSLTDAQPGCVIFVCVCVCVCFFRSVQSTARLSLCYSSFCFLHHTHQRTLVTLRLSFVPPSSHPSRTFSSCAQRRSHRARLPLAHTPDWFDQIKPVLF